MTHRRFLVAWLSVLVGALASVSAGAGAASAPGGPPPKKGPSASEMKLVASDAAPGDRFGFPVAVSDDGKVALIGAEQKSSFQGAAYIFLRGPHGWSQQQELTASDGAPFDVFGSAVALSHDGKVALVGAVQKDSSQGAAYVFVRGRHGWSQQQELTAGDGAPNDFFGGSASLSADGKTALVGAANNSGQGAAYVFARGPHEWSQRQKLTANDSAPNDQFGVSVAVSGNGKAALVGAHFNNGNRGAAYVFAGGPHGWSQTQKLTASDAAPFDQLGASVSLSGDGREALVGAVGDNGFRGAAYLYAGGPHGWSQQQKFVGSDAVAGDLFGDAVALSGDGHSALVGANDKSSAQGAAYVFARGPHSWSQRQELTASDGAAGDNFGLSVALNRNGKTALVGAPDPFLTTTGEGAAYAYSLE